MRIGFVEWPEGLTGAMLRSYDMADRIFAAAPEILVTNELPFGRWLADDPGFSDQAAWTSVRAHEEGLEALVDLKLPAIISTRPAWYEGRLTNEAFLLENGSVRILHRKQYFPDEPGFYEKQWYEADGSGFVPVEVRGVTIGVLLCTEALFNEHARRYGRQGTDLIVIPRATTGANLNMWQTAAAMATYVSGAYVVSSNRTGTSSGGVRYNGRGFAFAPHGQFLAETSPRTPVGVIDLDRAVVWEARENYPCYVPEH